MSTLNLVPFISKGLHLQLPTFTYIVVAVHIVCISVSLYQCFIGAAVRLLGGK